MYNYWNWRHDEDEPLAPFEWWSGHRPGPPIGVKTKSLMVVVAFQYIMGGKSGANILAASPKEFNLAFLVVGHLYGS